MTVYKFSHPGFGEYFVAPNAEDDPVATTDPYQDVERVRRAIAKAYPNLDGSLTLEALEMTREEYFAIPAQNDAITAALADSPT